jgi:hypothetical protein
MLLLAALTFNLKFEQFTLSITTFDLNHYMFSIIVKASAASSEKPQLPLLQWLPLYIFIKVAKV